MSLEQAIADALQPRTLSLGGADVQVWTRPGYEHWDEIDPATELLARQARIEAGDRVLVWPCGHGALAVWAMQRGAAFCEARDAHLVASQASEATLAAAGLAETTVTTSLPPEVVHTPFDLILMHLPKGRQAARMALAQACVELAPGGRLYLAGANDAGIKSVLRDAEALFGKVAVLGYKQGHRLALLTAALTGDGTAAVDWLTDGVRPGSYLQQTVMVGDQQLALVSKPGVFSWQHLDAGTALLIDHLELAPNAQVLDVGCGCGVIGAWAARKAAQGQVTLLDVDALAVDCARRTLATNQIGNASAMQRDGLTGVPGGWDLIVSNPPFHAGHTITHHMVEALIAGAPRHLLPGGRLVLVANRFLPYDRQMMQVFGNASVLANTGRFHVLTSVIQRTHA